MRSTSLAFLIRLATGVPIAGGLPVPDRPRIYFANHSSHLDFVVIWASLPLELRTRVRPVAAAEYWESSGIRRWLAAKIFNAVLIPRNPARMRKENPIELMTAALQEGSDLILFPEGTRSQSDEIAPFKAGFYHVTSKNPEVELMPVYLENLNRILPKGEGVPIPLMGHIDFGTPIDPPGSDEEKTTFLERSRAAVVELSRGTLTTTANERS